MNVTKFNITLSETEINKESATQIINAYLNLKRESPDITIIETANKEKFAALLKVIGQKHENYNLSKEDLSNLDFSDFIFVGCQFEYTNFESSNMDAIEFRSCCIDHAVFHKAMMECSCFRSCSCKETDFSNAHLLASYIEDSDWRRADISSSNLLELEAHDWNIEGVIIDENTSINEGEFSNVDWSKTNVSNLSISLDQVKYFLQSTNGGKFLNVYTNYEKSSFEQKEDAILMALLDGKEDYLEKISLKPTKLPLIFVSYASEQETTVRYFYNTQKINFPLWMDTELIKDEPLRMQLETIISNCSKAVIFLSKEYMVKAWTRYEFYRVVEESRQRDLDVRIIPVSSEIGLMVNDIIKKENGVT